MTRDYDVSMARRIAEIIGTDTIPASAELAYSFNQGYERLTYREHPDHGSLSFEGAYHPDGFCVGRGGCIFCGRTLFSNDPAPESEEM